MNEFNYRGDDLYCEDVPVQKIVSDMGTPLYIYSRKTLENHFRAFDAAFTANPHITCYSVKANSNLSVLKIFAEMGAGVDVVSGGEIYRALKAGVSPEKIVYSGVGKSSDEIKYALHSGILMFNIESSQELDIIDSVAGNIGKKARIAIRINPDIDPKTHPYISTGLKKNKFGIGVEDALEEYKRAALKKNVEIAGVACHIGSQITETKPFVDALQRVKQFIGELAGYGIDIKYIDVGGGLGITYDNEMPPLPSEYGSAVISVTGDLGCTLILEPGRVIAGNAGILVAQVLYTKESGDRNFFVVDAAMNDLVRPSLYDAFHEIMTVKKKQTPEVIADIVGPICESGDFIARQRKMNRLEQGDCIAVMSAGAYGFTMSSNYNSRPRVPEIIVDGQRYFVVRRRETYDDLVMFESMPELNS